MNVEVAVTLEVTKYIEVRNVNSPEEAEDIAVEIAQEAVGDTDKYFTETEVVEVQTMVEGEDESGD